MAIEDWQDLRKRWVKERDTSKPKVGMGAVKGVKLGESIEGVYKAYKSARTYDSLETPGKGLLAAVAKYKTGIAKKNPALVTWIEKNVERPAHDLLTGIQADSKALQDAVQYYDKHRATPLARFPGNLLELPVLVQKAGKPLKTLDPKAYKQMVDATEFFDSVAKTYGTTAKNLQVQLPANAVRKQLHESAVDLKHYVGLMTDIVKASSDGADFGKKLGLSRDCPDMFVQLASDGYAAMRSALR